MAKERIEGCFLEWIINTLREDEDTRDLLLRLVKFNPHQAQKVVNTFLRSWMEEYPGKIRIIHLDHAPCEIIQAIRMTFSDELIEIT